MSNHSQNVIIHIVLIMILVIGIGEGKRAQNYGGIEKDAEGSGVGGDPFGGVTASAVDVGVVVGVGGSGIAARVDSTVGSNEIRVGPQT